MTTPASQDGVAITDLLDAILAAILAGGGGGGTVDQGAAGVDPWLVTGEVMVVGVSTAAKQDTGNTSLASIDTKLTGVATNATLASGFVTLDTDLANIFARLGNGSQHTIVDGTVAISAAALPLPAGAATGAKQDTGNTSLTSIDGKITACNTNAVTVTTCALPTGASTAARQDTGNTSLASIDTKLTSQATGAKQDTGNTSLASIDTKLTNVATTAKQDTGNTSLASIDASTAASKTDLDTLVARTPALGAATTAGSTPVNIASDQTLTVTSTTLDTLLAEMRMMREAVTELTLRIALHLERKEE